MRAASAARAEVLGTAPALLATVVLLGWLGARTKYLKRAKGLIFQLVDVYLILGCFDCHFRIGCIQENLGWGLGYGIPTAGLLLSLVIFCIGTPIYHHKVSTTKTPAWDIISVPIAAFRIRKLQLPSNPSDLYEHNLQHYVNSGKRQVYPTPTLR
ncbi:hypothetical protein JHK84_043789 [Glycine max]|nr:hypothetical protein JHK84_043789 [Glycine max]